MFAAMGVIVTAFATAFATLFDALNAAHLPVLTLAWAIPLAAALPLAAATEATARRWFIPLAALPMLLLLPLIGGFALTHATPHPLLTETLGAPQNPLRYALRLDTLNSPFLLLTALLGLLLAIYGRFAGKTRFPRWAACCLALQAILLGAQLADTPLLFGLFLAAELIPTAALCIGWGTGDGRAAARGTLTFLATATALWITGALLTDRGAHPHLAFALLITALAIRMPTFPFHGWLPRLIREGPIVALPVYFVGLEIAALALIRFVLPAHPGPTLTHAPLLAALGLTGLIYGIFQAFGRRDLREVLAFTSIAHSGFILAGLFTLTAAGLEGGVLTLLNLGISAAGLFFLVGFLYVREGTTDLASLRGAIAAHPALSFAFLALALTSIGMPGTAGFDGLHLLIEGALHHRHLLTAIALGVGGVLIGGTLLSVYQQIAFGDDAPRPTRDLHRIEALVVLALMALVFGLGFEAPALVNALHAPAQQLITRIEASAPPAAEPPAAEPPAADKPPAPKKPAKKPARPKTPPKLPAQPAKKPDPADPQPPSPPAIMTPPAPATPNATSNPPDPRTTEPPTPAPTDAATEPPAPAAPDTPAPNDAATEPAATESPAPAPNDTAPPPSTATPGATP